MRLEVRRVRIHWMGASRGRRRLLWLLRLLRDSRVVWIGRLQWPQWQRGHLQLPREEHVATTIITTTTITMHVERERRQRQELSLLLLLEDKWCKWQLCRYLVRSVATQTGLPGPEMWPMPLPPLLSINNSNNIWPNSSSKYSTERRLGISLFELVGRG